MKKKLARKFAKKALQYLRDEYPDTLSYAQDIDPNTFRNLRERQFLSSYCWVIYAKGIKVDVLEDKFPSLQKAFKDFDPNALSRMRSLTSVLNVFNNKRKAEYFLSGAHAIHSDGFVSFKRRIRKEGLQVLESLPGIGTASKDHLAINIGLADTGNNVVWLEQAATLCGATSAAELTTYLAEKLCENPHVINVAICQYGADGQFANFAIDEDSSSISLLQSNIELSNNAKEKYTLGDHLVSPRTAYTHHGLYIGNNQVIHYSGFAIGVSNGEISIASLREFRNGHEISVQNHSSRKYDREVSVQRAFQRLGEDWYNVLLNNCEHFVTWCIEGFHSSSQVNRLIKNVAVVAVGYSMSKQYVQRNVIEAAASQLISKSLSQEIGHRISHVAASGAAKSILSSSAGTVAGLAAGASLASGTTGTTVALASGLAATSAAPVVLTVAVAAGIGYGVKKLVDLISD